MNAPGQLPLKAGGEAAASSAAQAGVHQTLDDIIGSHLCENLAQGSIAAGADVLFNHFRVDHAAVAQGDPVLLLVEVRIYQRLDSGLGHGLLVKKAGYHPAL